MMTIEKARDILKECTFLGNCPLIECAEAKSFIAGHASRDPEVAELRSEIDGLNKENRRLEAQQKAWHGLLFLKGETYQPYATPEGGVVPVVEPIKVTRILDELSAECQASRKLVKAANMARAFLLALVMNGRESSVTKSNAQWPYQKLTEALKFYATPGHSPEGKTL